MICKNCGSEVPEGFAFCTNCGAAMSTAQPEAAPAASFFSPAGSLDETPTTEPVTKTAPIAAPAVESFESSVSEPEVVFGEMPQKPHSKVLGIIALICGIVSLLYPIIQLFSMAQSCCAVVPIIGTIFAYITGCIGCMLTPITIFLMIASPLCGIAGIVLGILAAKSAKNSGCTDALGKIGLILSIVGLVAFVVFLIISIVFAILGVGLGVVSSLPAVFAEMFGSSSSYSDPYSYSGGYY